VLLTAAGDRCVRRAIRRSYIGVPSRSQRCFAIPTLRIASKRPSTPSVRPALEGCAIGGTERLILAGSRRGVRNTRRFRRCSAVSAVHHHPDFAKAADFAPFGLVVEAGDAAAMSLTSRCCSATAPPSGPPRISRWRPGASLQGRIWIPATAPQTNYVEGGSRRGYSRSYRRWKSRRLQKLFAGRKTVGKRLASTRALVQQHFTGTPLPARWYRNWRWSPRTSFAITRVRSTAPDRLRCSEAGGEITTIE